MGKGSHYWGSLLNSTDVSSGDAHFLGYLLHSLKLTANAPENRPVEKGNEKVFQPAIFRGELAVSFREGTKVSMEVIVTS